MGYLKRINKTIVVNLPDHTSIVKFMMTHTIQNSIKRGTLFPELDLIESNNYNDWLYANPKNRVRAKKG